MFSFYSLESSVIGHKKHDRIRAAYLFYYASDIAFSEDSNMKQQLKARLNELVHDSLILAKKVRSYHSSINIMVANWRIVWIRCHERPHSHG